MTLCLETQDISAEELSYISDNSPKQHTYNLRSRKSIEYNHDPYIVYDTSSDEDNNNEEYNSRQEYYGEFISNYIDKHSQEDTKLFIEELNEQNDNNIKNPIWENTCEQMFINSNKFELLETKTNGDCLFDSIAIGFQIFNIDVRFLRSIVADSFIEETEEANTTLQFWREIYKMATDENDKTLMDEYCPVECLKDVPLDQEPTKEQRKSVAKIIMSSRFWGEQYSIRMIEKDLGLKIIIIDGLTNTIKPLTNACENPDHIMLLYHYVNHYQVISFNEELVHDINDIPEKIQDIINSHISS